VRGTAARRPSRWNFRCLYPKLRRRPADPPSGAGCAPGGGTTARGPKNRSWAVIWINEVPFPRAKLPRRWNRWSARASSD